MLHNNNNIKSRFFLRDVAKNRSTGQNSVNKKYTNTAIYCNLNVHVLEINTLRLLRLELLES